MNKLENKTFLYSVSPSSQNPATFKICVQELLIGMTNYMKTCSFLHAPFTEKMKVCENLFLKMRMVNN